ncbi:deoxyribonuclease V [Celerinatantimonas diazotrophica]|uniref:Endonuclease V n=1 Tax=Celerinatantimonas diazotrophica TaxID=412034 RepID=A0A4R1KGF3_9GAMM|nr:deoxyribonuclease V [Celerinatantimonas diazotrophica]TCK63200.1 endonuclease V [Celerinatantimonas diazotrophica]CAG9295569.1 Endonuclease V [Celerinatantimonas diazotrophica]
MDWQWPFSVQQAREFQTRAASQLQLTPFQHPVRCIAGADIGLPNKGSMVRAAICTFDANCLTPLELSIVTLPNTMPYIPGLLGFREVPALVRAYELLENKPQLVLVDGQGIAHPRRFGNASQLGWQLNIATIGVAKSKLTGEHQPLEAPPGSVQPLIDENHIVGYVLRSKARCKPLYLSPGNRVSTEQSLSFVRQCLDGYRLPKPTRWADAFASNRPSAAKLLKLLSPDKVHQIT